MSTGTAVSMPSSGVAVMSPAPGSAVAMPSSGVGVDASSPGGGGSATMLASGGAWMVSGSLNLLKVIVPAISPPSFTCTTSGGVAVVYQSSNGGAPVASTMTCLVS